MILEICAGTLQSALNAQENGADRVELCHDLFIGGVTPDHGIIEQAKAALDIPIHVLIRCRGGDFCYSSDEIELMKEDIAFCRQAGCEGVVIGALTAENRIDVNAMQELMAPAKGMDITFHRAFDELENPFEGLEQLIDLGLDRILTSGGATSAIAGMDLLTRLVSKADDMISVMPGGGVRPENIGLLKSTGALEFHSSALLGGHPDSDSETIKRLVQAVH